MWFVTWMREGGHHLRQIPREWLEHEEFEMIKEYENLGVRNPHLTPVTIPGFSHFPHLIQDLQLLALYFYNLKLWIWYLCVCFRVSKKRNLFSGNDWHFNKVWCKKTNCNSRQDCETRCGGGIFYNTTRPVRKEIPGFHQQVHRVIRADTTSTSSNIYRSLLLMWPNMWNDVGEDCVLLHYNVMKKEILLTMWEATLKSHSSPLSSFPISYLFWKCKHVLTAMLRCSFHCSGTFILHTHTHPSSEMRTKKNLELPCLSVWRHFFVCPDDVFKTIVRLFRVCEIHVDRIWNDENCYN